MADIEQGTEKRVQERREQREREQLTTKILRADGPDGGRVLVFTDLSTARKFGSIQEAEKALSTEGSLWVVRPPRDAEGLPYLALRVRDGLEQVAQRVAGEGDRVE